MTQPIQQRIAQLIEAWNSHDPRYVAGYYSNDCDIQDVAIAQPLSGQQGVQSMFAAYYHAFPDLKITPDDVIVTGQRVALFWTARGTHQGPILNIPASGRRIEARGVNRLVLREDGQVCETFTVWDVAGMLRGLGLLPDL